MIQCLRMLLEGMSIRSVERLTGVNRDTIIAVMVEAGRNCERFMEARHRNLPVNDVEVDEIWGFVGCKERTRQALGHGEEMGDAWSFTAIERTTKLIICWHVGKRTPGDTWTFAEKLHNATAGRFQISTDGFRPYRTVIPHFLGDRTDFATIVKVYGKPHATDTEARYSPPQVVAVTVVPMVGDPDPDRICTSHVERANRSFRMAIRRLTRLTDAHSKKWANHEAAFALFVGYYNYCRVHMTLKTTPAVAAGLTDRVWSVDELLTVTAGTQR
jgi:IS1 family transposase